MKNCFNSVRLAAAGLAAAGIALGQFAARAAAPITPGPNATVLKDGRPCRAIGVNYYDCFARTLENGADTSYDAGFATLQAKGIPFARFSATGYWPRDMKLYQADRPEYFRRLDGVVASAQRHGIGLIPSLFWYHACVPDLVGEPMDQWANPAGKTQAFMRQYVREVVTRYRDNPAIWAWEFGNEYLLSASLPNAREHRPPIHPSLGTATNRSERDDLSFAMVRDAYTAFAREVRQHDPQRLIITGDAFPRPSAWHQERENRWKNDSPEQFAEVLALGTPDPIQVISVHMYKDDHTRLAAAMDVSRKLNKPLFVGEFGVESNTPEDAARLRRMVAALQASQVPLAALWVFDFQHQQDFSVTATNARAWQLDLIAEANRTMMPGAAAKPRMMFGDESRLGRPFAKDPSVIKFGGRYLMYFSLPPFARERAPANAPRGWSIGIAESRNLADWQKIGELRPEQECEQNGLCAPGALVLNGQVHLFYLTYGNGPKDALCHAVSADGQRFRRDPANPVFRPTGNWNSGRAIDAEVFPDGDRLLLYFATRDPASRTQMLGVASADLKSDFSRGAWRQICDGPILQPELPWETRCIEAPTLMRRGETLVMFYAGGYNNDPQQIGVATSRDGVKWTRLSDQPLLRNGAPGEWNSSESGHPGVFVDRDGRTYLFYQGNPDKGRTWLLSVVEIAWKNERPEVRPLAP
jgi:predicted GH43/DUF377 family glycosyl hydrolase